MNYEQRMVALVRQLGNELLDKGLKIATAESCTGGWVAKVITDVPGSSAWFDCGFVTYSNVAKQTMLGVSEAVLLQHGAVSEATVRAMAEGALTHSLADLSVAISGIAGPGGGTPTKPVGTVWLAWAWRGQATQAHHHLFSGDREAVRVQAVMAALEGLLARTRESSA